MKKISFYFLSFISVFCFLACSNFMQGANLKSDIEQTIKDNEFYSVKRPQILNTNPMNGATNIARSSSIRIVFSDELNPNTLELDSSIVKQTAEEFLIKSGDGKGQNVGYIKDGQKVFNKLKITIISGTKNLPAENYFNAPYVKGKYIELWPDSSNVIPANTELKVEVNKGITNKEGIAVGKDEDWYTWSFNYGDKIENTNPVITRFDLIDDFSIYNFDSINAYLTDSISFTLSSLDNDTEYTAGDLQTIAVTEEIISDFINPVRNGEKFSSTYTSLIKDCSFGNITTDSIDYNLVNKAEGLYKLSINVYDDNGAISVTPEVIYLLNCKNIPESCFSIKNSTLCDDDYIIDENILTNTNYDDFIMEKLWDQCLTFDYNLNTPSVYVENKEYSLNIKIKSLKFLQDSNVIEEFTGTRLAEVIKNNHIDLRGYKSDFEQIADKNLILEFTLEDVLGNNKKFSFTISRKNKLIKYSVRYRYDPTETQHTCTVFLENPETTKMSMLIVPSDKTSPLESINDFYNKWQYNYSQIHFLNKVISSGYEYDDYFSYNRNNVLAFLQTIDNELYGFPSSNIEFEIPIAYSGSSHMIINGKTWSITPDGKNSDSYTVKQRLDLSNYSSRDDLTAVDNKFYLRYNDTFIQIDYGPDSNKTISVEYKVRPTTTTSDNLGYSQIICNINDDYYPHYVWDMFLYCGYDVTAPYFTDNKLILTTSTKAGINIPKDDKSGFLITNNVASCNYYFADYKNYWNGISGILSEEEIKALPLNGKTNFPTTSSSKINIPLESLFGKYLLCIDVEDNAKNYTFTDHYNNTVSQGSYYGSEAFNNNFCDGLAILNIDRFQNNAEFSNSPSRANIKINVLPEADKNYKYKVWREKWDSSLKTFSNTSSTNCEPQENIIESSYSLSTSSSWYKLTVTGEKSTEEETSFVFSEPFYCYSGTNTYSLKNATDDDTFGTTIWCTQSTFYRILSSKTDYGNDFTKWSKYAKPVKESVISSTTTIDVSEVPDGEYYVVQAYFSDAQKTKWMSNIHKK